jgi:YHS domain-containing protein/thiol-disulfide isomerase/thioredoxin
MRVLLQTVGTLSVLVAAAAASGQDQMPWQPNLEAAQRVAAETNRLVLIHFWAPWCRPCVQLDSTVFADSATAKGLEANFVLVKLNADQETAARRRFGVSSLPTDVIITPSGTLVAQLQSPPTAAQYVKKMNQAAEGHRSLARKPVSPAPTTTQKSAPPGNAGAMVDPYASPAPGAQAAAAPPADPYAEYFPAEQRATAPPNAQSPVMPAQATVSPPPAAAPVDPYATPAPAVPPYGDRYAQGPQAPPAAPAAAAQAPLVDPYAAPPAAPVASAQQSVPYVPAQPMTDSYASVPPAQPAAVVAPSTPPPAAPPAAAYGAQASFQPQMNLPQLPPGCPPVGLEGNCPVTLLERKRWAVGNTAYGAVHRGRTYLFLGPQEKEKFLADPDRYSPMLSGLDPVHALDGQQAVPGKREFGVFGADGRVYLFADEHTRARFEQNEQLYTQRVQQAVAGLPPTGPAAYQAMRPAGR